MSNVAFLNTMYEPTEEKKTEFYEMQLHLRKCHNEYLKLSPYHKALFNLKMIKERKKNIIGLHKESDQSHK